MPEKREYAIAAYLALLPHFSNILAKFAYHIFFLHILAFLAASNILCSNFSGCRQFVAARS